MLASGLLGVATVGVITTGGMAYAHAGRQDNMADAIANKFKLNKTEVQQVIKDQRKQNHEQRQQERIAELVKDGKITQEQADKLKVKLQSMEAKREAAHNETDPAKRKAAHEAIKAEMEQWAKDNGIDPSVIRPPRGEREAQGLRGHRMQMMQDRDDAPRPE